MVITRSWGPSDEAVVLSALLRQAFLLRLHFGPRQAQAAEWTWRVWGYSPHAPLLEERGDSSFSLD